MRIRFVPLGEPVDHRSPRSKIVLVQGDVFESTSTSHAPEPQAPRVRVRSIGGFTIEVKSVMYNGG